MSEGRGAIDPLRAADGTLDREAVRQILPYGDAFLFVDGVLELTAEAVTAVYRVPQASDWLDAHFEGFPVVPGVILGEGFGQAASLLVRYNLEPGEPREVVGLETDRARFLRPAFPGDRLLYRAELERLDSRAARVRGRVLRDERTVASFRLVLGVVPRRLFRAAPGISDRE